MILMLVFSDLLCEKNICCGYSFELPRFVKGVPITYVL